MIAIAIIAAVLCLIRPIQVTWLLSDKTTKVTFRGRDIETVQEGMAATISLLASGVVAPCLLAIAFTLLAIALKH